MNILITSVGRRSYMVEYFKAALEGKGEVHAANSDFTYALQTADQHVIAPPIYDDSYIAFLLDYCRKHTISGILSLFDVDLPVLSENKEKFNKIGVKLVISDPKIVKTCNDKWETYRFLSTNGFLVPKTFLNVENAEAAISRGEIEFPLIVKPRWGMGSIGIFEAEDITELDTFYKKVKNTITKTYLKYESSTSLNEAVIIQEKILGKEYGLDIFNNLEGDFLSCVPKQKLAMRAGETDIARVLRNPAFIKLGKRLSECTKHMGNLDVDFFVNDDADKVYILEMNCRFGGQYPFAHLAGVNFPNAIVEMLSGRKVSTSNLEFGESVGYKDFIINTLR